MRKLAFTEMLLLSQRLEETGCLAPYFCAPAGIPAEHLGSQTAAWALLTPSSPDTRPSSSGSLTLEGKINLCWLQQGFKGPTEPGIN